MRNDLKTYTIMPEEKEEIISLNLKEDRFEKVN